MREKFTLKNKSIDDPLVYSNVTIYGLGEVRDSKIGEFSVIGENSRVHNSLMGNYVSIDRNNLLKNVEIGDFSYTGPFDMIFECEIGKFTSISYGVTIGPPEHNYSLISTHPFVYERKYNILHESDLIPNDKFEKIVKIGNDVWIGCNTTILRGVEIGHGAIVGANSLVNKDVPPYAIVAGCPARIIKYRFSQEDIDKLLELEWWNWDIERIRKNARLFTNTLTKETFKDIK